jgi:hypothetical protein
VSGYDDPAHPPVEIVWEGRRRVVALWDGELYRCGHCPRRFDDRALAGGHVLGTHVVHVEGLVPS